MPVVVAGRGGWLLGLGAGAGGCVPCAGGYAAALAAAQRSWLLMMM